MFNRLKKSKTFWMAIAGLITAVITYFSGDITGKELGEAIYITLTTIFIRDGIEKS